MITQGHACPMMQKEIEMKMMQLTGMLMIMVLIWMVCSPLSARAQAQEGEETGRRSFVYGQSELGRDLICYAIGNEQAEKSVLIVFGVHGFEDDFNHDAEVLRLIAEEVIAYYAGHPELLENFCLYIIPSANPDGLYDGKTQDGFGRCNAKGMDVNRDFPVGWKKRTDSRNLTGDEPFSTAEARAIRDLVASVAPTYGIDVHGWINASYGDGEMARVFAKPFKFTVKQPVSGGMLCMWLNEVTEEAIMLELPFSPNKKQYVKDNSSRLIEGLNRWMELSAGK